MPPQKPQPAKVKTALQGAKRGKCVAAAKARNPGTPVGQLHNVDAAYTRCMNQATRP
jgi:hypothetical protein